MKHLNWLDWETDGNFLTLRPNKAFADKPLITLSASAGSLQFAHTMRPDQARALAQDLLTQADDVEFAPFVEQALKALDDVGVPA